LLFFDGYPNKGLCPAGDNHSGNDSALLIPHKDESLPIHSEEDDPHNNGNWRFCVKCHGMVKSNQGDFFPGVTACVVDNANHDLPEREGKGVVMMTRSWWVPNVMESGFRLAWMPLKAIDGPRLQDVLYYTGKPGGWSPNPSEARMVFPHPSNFYTSLSLTWLDGPKCWILLYSDNTPDSRVEDDPIGLKRIGPVMARFSTQLWNWSEPIQIFDPRRENAYGAGKYMHFPGHDTINRDVPPLPPTLEPGNLTNREDRPGCAYGAFIVNRFTQWNGATRVLEIYYLLSTGRPYQVLLMHTQLRFPDEPGAPSDTLFALGTAGIDFSVPEADLLQWLSTNFTSYPALAEALLTLLVGTRLRRPVYLDVIVWNYEHAPGASSPRNVAEVDLSRLRAAVVEGYNTRYGESVTDFQRLVQ
jgi:hypothetical protein